MATQNSINKISNPLASTAVTIDPGASGDSFVQFDINTTGEFRVGVDDTDDSFRMSAGSALGTNDTFVMTAAGERTLPLQPAFWAEPSGTLSNVTGDGTAYTVVFATESFDQGADFDGTSTFTAPVAGLYCFTAYVRWSALTLGTDDTKLEIQVNAGSPFIIWLTEPDRNGSNGGSYFVSLAAADAVTVVATASGGSKDVDLLISTNSTSFSCYLVA